MDVQPQQQPPPHPEVHSQTTRQGRPARPAFFGLGLLLVAIGVFTLALLIMPLQRNPEERDVLPRQSAGTFIASSGRGIVASLAVVAAGLVIANLGRRRQPSM